MEKAPTNIRPKKEALTAAIAIFIMTLLCNVLVTSIARAGLINEIENYLTGLASTAAIMTNGDIHETITKPEQKNSADYKKLQSVYKQVLSANPKMRYMYSMVMRNEGVYFIIDTPGNVPDGSAKRPGVAQIMEYYPDVTPTLIRALKEHIPLAEDKTSKDKWGEFVSGYAPILNSKKQFVGIVGADMDASEFNKRMMFIWLAFGAGTILSGAISIFAYFVVLRMRTSAKEKLHLSELRLNLSKQFNQQIQKFTSDLSSTSVKINSKAGNISKIAEHTNSQTEEALGSIHNTSEQIQSIAKSCEELLGFAKEVSQQAHKILSDSSKTMSHFKITESIDKQKDLIKLINYNISGVSENAKKLEDAVSTIAHMTKETKEDTGNLFEAINDLSHHNQELNIKVYEFLRQFM